MSNDEFTDELIAAVAREHGIAIAPDDPVFAVLTMNERVLGAYLEQALGDAADTHAQWVEQVATARRELKAIGPALERAAEQGREAMTKASRDEAAQISVRLAQEVADSVRAISEGEAARRKAGALTIAAGAVALAAVVTVAGGAAMYATGQQHGREAAAREAADRQEAGSWGATADGQLARRLWQAGGLRMVANCEGKGWKRKRVEGVMMCYPMAAKDGVYGWPLPR